MNTTVKIGIGILLLLAISAVCAENTQYTAIVYAPANLSVSVDAPSVVSLDDNFVVTANVSNNGTENASDVVTKLIFIDEDNDIKHTRRAFIYGHQIIQIGNLNGGDSLTVSWDIRTKAKKEYIGKYSIVVTANGIAEISGLQLEDEQRSPIVIPGFEIICAITGLLAVSYLLRRRKSAKC
jgi:PGF-CTERM protein